MKKLFVASIVGLAMALCLCAVSQDPAYAGGKKIQMNFASVYMNRHNTVVNGFKPWMKEIEKKTSGKVKMNYFDPNTLCPLKENWDSTVSGAVDFGTNYCPFNPGKFVLAEAMEMPLIVPSAEAGSLVTWELYKKYPKWRAQFKNAKLLWQWTSATYQIHTKGKMIRTLEDLKGMKIIGWSPRLIQMIKLLGGSPIDITATDTYLAIERGMADGVLCPLAPIRSYKISDTAKYHTIIDMNVGPFWAAMNTSLWESLTPDIQKVYKETTGEKMARICGKTLDEGAVADSQWLKKQGNHKFYVVPDKEKERWFKAVTPLHEAWIKKAEGRGYKNARVILEDAVRLGKKYAKTTGRGYQE